ncbi:ATP-binding protein [Niabella pedocola]|uniref:ATP-binding protein n=1 Tax=Niabella pedocola TaxID=1752077 RepID=A0ABS8PQC6_9BACT|nr:ATP-binding protein [Niabella pedocola]MCD2423298.1 ATP-binding protein [Niabella pedocola]
MNYTIHIQSALAAVNQATFERLISYLLYMEGYKFMGAPGLVVGKDKTRKGGPDAFFIDGDRYIFVESTTKEKLPTGITFFNKLKGDICHCFDQKVTGIEARNIKRIILACTSKITVAEHKKLVLYAKSFSKTIELEILNIDNLPLKLERHPTLLGCYLGIQVLKADIYDLPHYLSKSTQGYQPSLINSFVARKDELKTCLNLLTRTDVLAIYGPSGVGKSKLAVQLLENMREEGFCPLVIQSSAIPIYDDLNSIFSGTCSYVVLLDDINRSIDDLSSILSYIKRPRINTIKVIVTARDYASGKVTETLEDAEIQWQRMTVNEMKDGDIETIITNDQPWLKRSYTFKRRVVELAKGNARLAMMATQAVERGGSQKFLDNPVLLYQKYFNKAAGDLHWIKEPLAIQAIAIVWFFQRLEKRDDDIHNTLKEQFGIEKNDLWSMLEKLHSSEMINLFENDLAKPQDQPLGTFAFYRCFLEGGRGLIDLGKWMTTFFSQYAREGQHALIDVNNTFGDELIQKLSMPHLDYLRQQLSESADIYEFYSMFWFYRRNETLVFIQDWINAQESKGVHKLSFRMEQNVHQNPQPYLELLVPFWCHPNESLKASIELAIELVAKDSALMPYFLYAIKELFSFRATEAEFADYRRQNLLLDVLEDPADSELQQQIVAGVALVVATKLLKWQFKDDSASKGIHLSWVDFKMANTPELLALRERLLKIGVKHFDVDKILATDLMKVLVYPGGDMDSEVYRAMVPFFNLILKKLSELQFNRCVWVMDLKERLKQKNVSGLRGSKRFEQSEVLMIHALLNGKPYDRDISVEKQNKYRWSHLKRTLKSKTWLEIKMWILRVSEVLALQENGSNWSLDRGMSDMYGIIGGINKTHYKKAVELYFKKDLSFKLDKQMLQYSLQERLISARKLLALIRDSELADRDAWIMQLASAVAEPDIFTQLLESVIVVLQTDTTQSVCFDMSAYLKFQLSFEQLQKNNPRQRKLKGHNIITYLSQIVYSRRGEMSWDLGRDFCRKNIVHFSKHMQLLEDIYICQKRYVQHYDHNGKELGLLLSYDWKFLIRSLKSGKIGFDYTATLAFDRLTLNSVWELDNYQEVIEEIMAEVAVKKDTVYIQTSDIENLFAFRESFPEATTQKVKATLSKLIEFYAQNNGMIQILLTLVFESYRNDFIEHLKGFLILNKDVNFVSRIHFYRTSSTIGSWVPQLLDRIKFYEQIITMINSLPRQSAYTEHKHFFEKKIVGERERITQERRRDFKDPD